MNDATVYKNSRMQPFLPPKFLLPSIATPTHEDHDSLNLKESPWLREGQRQNQCASTEIFKIEEEPSWLKELLDEPEPTITRVAHRRSSSDSFANVDRSRINSNINILAQEECRQRNIPLWRSHEFELLKDSQHFFTAGNASTGLKDTMWSSRLNMGTYSNCHIAPKEGVNPSISGASLVKNEAFALEKVDVSKDKHTKLDSDTKRVKQQFALNSRAQILQYITELENNIQVLQAKNSEVSAELDFVNQQNLILILENKILKQRLDIIMQDQYVKCFQQDVLQREIARLRVLFHQ